VIEELKTVTFKELQAWTKMIWTEGFGEALVQVRCLTLSELTSTHVDYFWGGRSRSAYPLSIELGTYKTVTARFWPWLSGESPGF